ncbi:hypothetical protein [Spongiimicrobium salis]|uniref:hypothetical protein n=1 Tax=Spongiimicrobium salis TaxID=1667022 RepID=UPI00374D3398
MNEKELKESAGKFKKLLETLKKIASKELLWLLLVVLISVVLALICSYVIAQYKLYNIQEVIQIIAGDTASFKTLFILCVIGVYFSRIVAMAVKTHLENKK